MVNGGATYRGRLEICISYVWGTVCDYSFDTSDARVACRQLGYEVDGGQAVSFNGNAYYGQGTGPTWLNYLYCTGSENSLLDCNRAYPIGYSSSCSHSEDVGIVCPANSCSSGSVRLTDGLIPTEGTVEVCHNGAWNSVCDNNWGYQEAFVVCRQLGLPATDAQAVRYTNSFGFGHGIPTLNNWRCFGNETNLNDCLRTTSSCFDSYRGVYRLAGVFCHGKVLSGNCITGSMRLVGPNGPNKVEGRVEYCSNGVWGTVSNYRFDLKDAHVVCRKLGYQQPRALVFYYSYHFGQGSGPVLFAGLNCIGNEHKLEDCPSSLYPYHYSHSGDVGVKCLEKALANCVNGSGRLVNGSTPDEGRVEVCINGEWGTACDQSWDRRETKVVCRQLGYSQIGEGSTFRNSKFGDGAHQYVLWNVQCSGSETNLSSCSNNYYEYCYYGRTVGIKCFNSTNCAHGEVKLYGGKFRNEGDLQICYNGVWVFLCQGYQTLANVVCRQLGYPNNEWYLFVGSRNVAPIVSDRFSCTGNEYSLSQCSNTTYNDYCDTAVGVYCFDIYVVNCSNGLIRLTNGGGDNEGKVEICTDGNWMTTEVNYWNYNNAKVVCRQLGFFDTWSVAITDINWSGKNERVRYRYSCTGNEINLENCSKQSPPIYKINWYNYNRGGVDCQHQKQQDTLCFKEGTIRLSNQDSKKGRVEICLNGYWGTVCSNGWDERDALVACKQAGYQSLRAIPVTGGYFGRGTGPVHMTKVDCTGNEEKLAQCSYVPGIGATNCYHAKDAGVICTEYPVYYSVNISVLNGPRVSINDKVFLHCNALPAPPINTTYNWRSTVSGGSSSITQYKDIDPNVTLTIHAGHSSHGNYYCIVKYNGVIIGKGHTVIFVKGLLLSSNANIYYSSNNDHLVGNLTVSVISTIIFNYLRELNWYHNGNKISNFNKYSITNDNKTLVINNITNEDFGEYSVRFDGLRLYHYNKDCEERILQVLRSYPVLRPLVFSLTSDGFSVNENDPPVYFSGVTVFSNKSAKVTMTSYFKEYCSKGSLSLYHNGNLLFSRVTSGILDSTFNPHYNYTITHPVITDSGYYEFQFVLDTSSVLSTLNCDGPLDGLRDGGYNNFLVSYNYLRLKDIICGNNIQKLEYYENPVVNFTATTTAFSLDSSVQLFCSASGGYPLYYNISLVKNNFIAANVIGTQLVHKTSMYGLYICTIRNTATEVLDTLLLKEKSNVLLSFEVTGCNKWSNSHIESSIRNRMEFLCHCSLEEASFMSSLQSCSKNTLSFSTIFIYASVDGSLTASRIIALMYGNIEQGRNTTFLIDGEVVSIASSTDNNNSGALAGLFFAGFIACAITGGIILMIICLISKWKHSNKSQSQDGVRYTSKPSHTVSTTANVSLKPMTTTKLPPQTEDPKISSSPLPAVQEVYYEQSSSNENTYESLYD